MSKLTISPSFNYSEIPYDKENEVHLDVVLTAPEKTDSTKRIPLNLTLVLDASGSMDGSKLGAVKKTVAKLIDHLTENDSLGILSFSSTVWDSVANLPMTSENKDVAKKVVNSLRSMDSTNLEMAIKIAMEKATISDSTKISRIILLTDGLPSCGECNKQTLIKLAGTINPSLSMTTFGFGEDFDAELMASISNMGKGSSFYIKGDEDCNKAFAMELGGLLSLYAQNLKLKLTPSGNMKFQELLSDYKCEQKNGYRLITTGSIEVTIDDIFFGEKKHVVFKLSIPSATEAVCARPTRVCDLKVSYTQVEDKVFEAVVGGARIQYVKPDKAQKDPDEEVRKQVLILGAAQIQKEAQEKAEKGDLVGARSMLKAGGQSMAGVQGLEGVVDMYENLTTNYADMNTYRSKGAKFSSAYRYSLTNARVSSADTMSFMNADQEQMLQSFSGTASSVGLTKGTISGEDPIVDSDDEDAKKKKA